MNTIALKRVARAKADASTVNRRIASFMADRGYKLAKVDASVSVFRRGSLFGSLTGFSPRKWAARVTVEWSGATEIGVLFDVNTTGQTVTSAERAFWDEEMAGLIATIEGREPPSTEVAERRIASIGQRVVLNSIAFAIVGGVLGIIVVTLLRSAGADIYPGLAGFAAGIGAAFGAARGLGRGV